MMTTYATADEAIAALGPDGLRLREKRGRWDVVLQMPAPKDWDYFLAQANNPASKPGADAALVRSMLVFPTKEEFASLQKRMPTVAQAIANAPEYLEFLGLQTSALEK